MKTITKYKLHLLDNNTKEVILTWEFDTKEKAIKNYIEKKHDKDFKNDTYNLEEYTTNITNVVLPKEV